MTDPTGLCFVSYRRTRATDVALLIAALRDRGVPTWQDISDLPTTPTEEELRRVLADPDVSSAILYVTPEVEHSAVIREVEAPAIIARYAAHDGFFAVPVAAGGLGYSDVATALGPNIGLTHMPAWNIHRVAVDPLDAAAAASIAELALHQRLAAIHERVPKEESLRIAVATRAAMPKGVGPALSIDLTHRFSGRVATSDDWSSFILPALKSVVRAIQQKTPNRDVEISGLVAIPAAVAIGAAFLSLGGVRTSWIQNQQSFGKASEQWGLHCDRKPSSFECTTHARTPGAADLAVLVSVAADVVPDFNASTSTLPPLRAILSIAPSRDLPSSSRTVLTAGQALDVAHLTIDALRAARATFQTRGTIHLFLAVPVGLAMMIGQLLNTFGTVQTYEHVPGELVPYQPAALLTPSV